MTRLLLLRHAQSEWNAQGRWQGVADPPLSGRGEAQALGAGPRLAPFGFSALVSSDLYRARRTAELIAPALGLTPREVDPGLREFDVGQWSGLTHDQIEARWPGAVAAWRQGRLASTPGGERRDAFLARVTAALQRVGASHPVGPVLVITHGGVIGSLAQSLGAEPARIAHLAGRWFDTAAPGVALGDMVALLDADHGLSPGDEATDLAPSTVLDTRHR